MFALAMCALALASPVRAQHQPAWEMEALTDEGYAEFDFQTGLGMGTNGVLVRYGSAFLTADQVTVNQQSGEVTADGQVRLQNEDQLWIGEHIRYNFKTRQLKAEQFRTGKAPVFAAGEGLHAELTNRLYIATNGVVTTDDVAEPAVKVRAKRLKIIPGDKVVASGATLYVAKVPVFYFPYYSRKLAHRANHFTFTPGYRSSFGPFLLGSYSFFLGDEFDGVAHLDYRVRRGVGLGPDLNYHLGRWGDGTFKYYYLRDEDPSAWDSKNVSPHDRQRVYFSYQAAPVTNLTAKALVRYQTDTNIVREFFESEYRQNPQPSTFVEINKLWRNFSLDAYVQPRVNDFLETVERLPDLRLTGYRQQLGNSPLYYESESSAGYYRRLFVETNSLFSTPDFAAARADTYHQLLLPHTFFGWLNVTPRAGGRLTYYSKADGRGATTDELYRGVFNTGAELSFKASRLWPDAHSDLFEVDGLRHILRPSVNYAYVPRPNYRGIEDLPQFDYDLPSLRPLPIEFPDYNAIDSIDSQHVMRLGMHNKLQTKRDGKVINLVDWDLFTDWRLQRDSGQGAFADLYSDLTLSPRSWLSLGSEIRYSLDNGQVRLSQTTLGLRPHRSWSWHLGHLYLRDDLSPDPAAYGTGNNLFSSSLLYRLDENWGFRAVHWFEARTGTMQEQDYTVFRDLRSWTAAITLKVRNSKDRPQDVTVAFSFWLKAFPGSNRDSRPDQPFF
ncbi:MAG TPA: LPS assembly protein LptD [Verrucomicrobiota bacterium]|nr:LPS assembly protein LptD [Verrucomicrobiota bacterium]